MTASATGTAPEKRTGLDTGTAILIFTLVSLVLTAGLFVINTVAGRRYRELDTASRRFVAAQKASSMMETGSDYLTENEYTYSDFAAVLYSEGKAVSVETIPYNINNM